MVDKYTRVVLTLIATSLLILVMEGLIPKASALPASCGEDNKHPCFIVAADTNNFFVRIKQDAAEANPVWVRIVQADKDRPVRVTVVPGQQ